MVSREPRLGLYVSNLLAGLPGIEHGFGTRNTPDWPGSPSAMVKQIHSCDVLAVDAAGIAGEGDALVTRTPGLWVAVKSADCLPLLLVDIAQRQVAAIHAGWRGVAGGIIARTIERMNSQAQDLRVAIGPGIGVCCFEVGAEVAERFGKNGRTCIDLTRECVAQLQAAGVEREAISIGSHCTRCNAADFHSFRRDKESAGRMYSAIRLTNK